jgi:RNA-directed DNA polymerase
MGDKIVQRTFSEVIGEIYEADFLGFSYGCRPGRSAHKALDAVSVALDKRRVNWVLDADVRGFLETATHYTPSFDEWGDCARSSRKSW